MLGYHCESPGWGLNWRYYVTGLSPTTPIGCTGVIALVDDPPGWWAAYLKAIEGARRNGEARTWHDASFRDGYRAGIEHAAKQLRDEAQKLCNTKDSS